MIKDNPKIHILDKKIALFQASDGFRTSMDSVFLAAACRARAGESVLDMGTGVGGAAFCLHWRVKDCHITGVEIQKSHADLAIQNIALNNAHGAIDIVCADIRNYAGDYRFDHVICNPPYLEAGSHTPSPLPARAIAMGHLHSPATFGISDFPPSPLGGEGRGEGRKQCEGEKLKPSPDLVRFARDLRKNQTDAETKLWLLLRDRRFLGLKFKRQHSIPPYIVDFVCLEQKVIIELDGGQHVVNQQKDQDRTKFLNSLGFQVLRFWNNDVFENIEGILQNMMDAFSPSSNLLPAGEKALYSYNSPPSPLRGEGRGEGRKQCEGEDNPTPMSLNDWIITAHKNLKSGGTFTIIHRADMIDKIILGMGKKFGGVEIIPLYPHVGEAARRVIVRAIKDRKTPARLHGGIVLHEENGDYTKHANTILRDGAAIE